MSEEKENLNKQNQCPECGKINTKDAIMCEECGAPLRRTGNCKAENKVVESYKICPNCENKCGVDDDFCNKCGQKLIFETKCPKCGADFTQEDLFCKKCGEKLPKIPKKETNSKIYCPSCGMENNAEDSFCAECGMYLKMDDIQGKQSVATKTPQSSVDNNYIKTDDAQNGIDKVKCPYCGSMIARYTKKCPHCGEWLKGGVSHFGCGSFLVLITTIIAICMAVGGESVGIPLVGEIGGLWLVLVAFLYFLPSLISDWRGHDSKLAIFLVNLLIGWTFIGWFIALIFSFTGRSR